MTEPERTHDKTARDGRRSLPPLDTRTLFVLVFALAMFVIVVRPALDPDMWWHLRTGEYILDEGIPRQDVFSFTVPERPWITHEWLSQVFMWRLYTLGGFVALILGFAAIVAVAFWLVYRTCVGRPYLAAFVTLLAALAAAPTWGARPQMFNLLFLAIILWLVEGVRGGRFSQRAYWWLPPLTALWANLHSGFMVGVVLLAVYAVGDAAQSLLRQWVPGSSDGPQRSMRQSGVLALVAALSLLAAALNPNGFQLWLYPFETLRSPAMQQFIQEWQAPQLRLLMFWPFAALLLLGVLSWTYGRRPSLAHLLLFLGAGAAGLISARNIPLFAVVAAPIICRALWPLLARSRLARNERSALAQKRPAANLVALNALLFLVCLFAGALYVAQMIGDQQQSIAERYPVAAVDFMEERGLDTMRGYNDYAWGGYLIWRGIPVFVDGRADVYGDDFLFFYLQAYQLERTWREPLEVYDVDYVLIGAEHRLAIILDEVATWQEIYADELARLFVRVD